MTNSLSQLDQLSKCKAAAAKKSNRSPSSLLQKHFLMQCQRPHCGIQHSGHYGKSTRKNPSRLVCVGLTKHLNDCRAKAFTCNTESGVEQTAENNCYLWYKQQGLYNKRMYDLSTSMYFSRKPSCNTPLAPVFDPSSNVGNNPFGLLAKSTLLSWDEDFGPKDSFQAPPAHEISKNLVALNKQFTHIHLENAFSAEAIRHHVLLTNLVSTEDDERDFDDVDFDFDPDLDVPSDEDESFPPSQLEHAHVDRLSTPPTEDDVLTNQEVIGGDALPAAEAVTASVRTELMDLLEQHQGTQQLHNLKKPQLRMEVSLMELCLKHRLPLSATTDFIEWARNCTQMQSNIFDAPTRNRDKIIEECRKALGSHGTNDFKETIIEWLPSRKPTSCFIRGFLQTVFELLHDTDIVGVGGRNLAFPHPTDPFLTESGSPLTRVSELCHASWFRESSKEYCNNPNEIFVPIVLGADASPCDGFGRLKVTPLLMTLGVIKKEHRRKRHCWKVISHLLDEAAESEKHDEPQKASDKLQNLHNTIALALHELKQLHESGDSVLWQLDYGGKKHTVHIKFGISFVVSDTEFHDKLCLSKGNYTETSKGPCRICNTDIQDLVDVKMFRLYEVYDPEELDPSPSYNRPDELFEELGQHRCLNAFYSLPMGSNKHNIHLATPPECLHAIERGPQVRCVEALLYAIKNGSKVEFEDGKFVAKREIFQGTTVTKLEYLAKRVGACIQRQSQRDKPRSKFGNGHFEKTKKTAREQAGVLLNLLVVMLSDRGRRILLEERGIHPEFLHKTVRVFEVLLQIDAWMKLDSYPANHILKKKKVGHRINQVVELIAQTCCREGMGARTIKNHLLLHLPELLEMYGPPSQWDSGPIEQFHKYFSKLQENLPKKF